MTIAGPDAVVDSSVSHSGDLEDRRSDERPAGLSARRASLTLGAIALVFCGLHVILAAAVHGPFVFMDELGYERSAWSLWHSGHVELFGKVGLAYAPLYSLLLAPLYGIASSASHAYGLAKSVNAALMALAIFPTFSLARSVLSRRSALVVAGLAALAPLAMYANLLMSESLAYPLFLVAILAMLRALRAPGVRNDALLLASILVASAARLQLVALVPAAITAIAISAALTAHSGGESVLVGWRRACVQHWLLLAPVIPVAIAVVVRTAVNGGRLPLAGRYANVGSARANPVHVVELAAQHLAGLDFAVGVGPFAAAILGYAALRRSGFARNGVIFASVAISATFWLVLETAFDAAAFDRSPRGSLSRSAALAPDLPRIHERYLIYLIPLFLVSYVAMLGRRRPRLEALGLAAAAAALLPAAIPFHLDVNSSFVPDSFALQIFGISRTPGAPIQPIAHATTAAVVISSALAVHFVLAMIRGYRRSAFALTAALFVLMSAFVWIRLHASAASATAAGLPDRQAWVDRVVGENRVAMIGGTGAQNAGLLETAFYNLSVDRIYYTCRMVFGADFGERRLTLSSGGVLGDGSGPLRVRYAVVPRRFGIRGRVLARNPRGGLVLLAPAGGKLVVSSGARAAARCGD